MANKWLCSYLSGRLQYVSYNGVNSDQKKVVCGVPQGSILSPLLFLLYINDLALTCKTLFTIMHADDINLFKEGPCLLNIQNIINEELKQVSKWLKLNKLSLNVGKTHFVIFKRKRQVINHQPTIYIDSMPIKQVKVTKFLGVYIDEHLSWQNHITHISSKIARGIGILRKARRF